MHWTTGVQWNGGSQKDSVASYVGKNLFYREDALVEAYASLDSFFLSSYWAHPGPDSFVVGEWCP